MMMVSGVPTVITTNCHSYSHHYYYYYYFYYYYYYDLC